MSTFHKILEVGIQLRTSSGNIKHEASVVVKKVDYFSHNILRHLVMPGRASSYVTMFTALIALITHVHLECYQFIKTSTVWVRTLYGLFKVRNHFLAFPCIPQCSRDRKQMIHRYYQSHS